MSYGHRRMEMYLSPDTNKSTLRGGGSFLSSNFGLQKYIGNARRKRKLKPLLVAAQHMHISPPPLRPSALPLASSRVSASSNFTAQDWRTPRSESTGSRKGEGGKGLGTLLKAARQSAYWYVHMNPGQNRTSMYSRSPPVQ